jgi:hypothetical protein
MINDEKNCPFCGETIKYVAIKCKHCQSNLVDEIVESNNSSNSDYVYYGLKRIQTTIWSALIICGVLFFTNPSKQDFVSWAQLKVNSYANQHLGTLGVGLAALLGGPVINNSVTRQNFYLFSIFIIDSTLVKALIEDSQKNDAKKAMVGVFGFVYFPMPQNIYDILFKDTSTSDSSTLTSEINKLTNLFGNLSQEPLPSNKGLSVKSRLNLGDTAYTCMKGYCKGTVKTIEGVDGANASIAVLETTKDKESNCGDYYGSGKEYRSCLTGERKSLVASANCYLKEISIDKHKVRFQGKFQKINNFDPEYAFLDIETNTLLDGSNASSYSLFIDYFSALCPLSLTK